MEVNMSVEKNAVLQKDKDYDGATAARVNIAPITTLAGADRGLDRLEKRQSWLKSTRLELKTKHASSEDDAEKIRLVEEDKAHSKEQPRIKSQLVLLKSKRATIVSEWAVDAAAYTFDDVE